MVDSDSHLDQPQALYETMILKQSTGSPDTTNISIYPKTQRLGGAIHTHHPNFIIFKDKVRNFS